MAGGEATNKTEVETFLLEKLQAGIDKNVWYSNKLKKMKESLEKQLNSAINDKDKGKIREKLYLLNDLINESNSRFHFFNWSLRSSWKQIKKEVQSLAKEIEDKRSLTRNNEDVQSEPAATNGAGDPPTKETVPEPAEERSTRTMAMEKALGLEADELAVKNLLLYQTGRRRDDFNAVGIVGAEGVGKTTLAQSIFAKEEVEKEFRPRIWISLAAAEDSAENLKIAIVKRILLALGIFDETIEKIRQSAKDAGDSILDALVHAIRLELMGKRYLIVLDDASEMKIVDAPTKMDDWYGDLSLEARQHKLGEKLGFAFPKGCGGTVLVIGWPENVVKYMVGDEESAIHRLLPLADPKQCWKIFEEAAKEGGGDQMGIADDIKVEDEVVKRSSGLPQAARLMGKIRNEKKKIQQPAAVVATT